MHVVSIRYIQCFAEFLRAAEIKEYENSNVKDIDFRGISSTFVKNVHQSDYKSREALMLDQEGREFLTHQKSAPHQNEDFLLEANRTDRARQSCVLSLHLITEQLDQPISHDFEVVISAENRKNSAVLVDLQPILEIFF